MQKLLWIIIVVLSSIFIFGCSSQEIAKTASNDSGVVIEISVKAFRFGFEPNPIIVKQGQTIRLKVESIDVPHGLAIPEYNINLQFDSKNLETVEFVANKKGDFPMFCSVPCGSGHGTMRGRLIVE